MEESKVALVRFFIFSSPYAVLKNRVQERFFFAASDLPEVSGGLGFVQCSLVIRVFGGPEM
jgi:hypothetical protein